MKELKDIAQILTPVLLFVIVLELADLTGYFLGVVRLLS